MKSLLFFLLLGTCVPAFASAPVEPLITRSHVADTHLSLRLANLEQDRTLVKLYDLDTKKTIFRQVVKDHNGFSINLSLEQLPEGRYVISVEKGDTLRRQVLRKTKTGIQCSDWK